MNDPQSLMEAGDADGLVRLGTELFRQGEEQQAFACYRAASKLGNVIAMGNLGFCYQTGRGVKQDDRLAAYCFERACELDDPGSMLKLGDFYFFGKGGLPRDRKRAMGYYLRAYEIVSSSPEPDIPLLTDLCYRLGTCKKDGHGTTQNFEDAYEYFQAVAELVSEDADGGDPRAMRLLQKAEAGMAECETHF